MGEKENKEELILNEDTADEIVEEKEDAVEEESIEIIDLDAEESEEDSEADEPAEESVEESIEQTTEEKPKKKLAGKILLSIVGVLLVVYLGFAFYFMNHFQFNTSINGIDHAMQSVADVEAHMEEEVASYALTLLESDGDKEKISGESISLSYKKGEELQKLVDKQNRFMWPVSLWEETKFEAPIHVSYNEKQLEEVIDSLACMKKENQKKPVSAKPVFSDGKFVVKEEETGSTIDKKVFVKCVKNYINEYKSELSMADEKCYTEPKYTKESKKVLRAVKDMNDYLGAEVTYKIDSGNVVVDSKQISKWIVCDPDTMEVSFKEEKVRDFVEKLADKYNTYGKTRTFTSGSGNKVKVSGGSYGWLINEEEEYQELVDHIKEGKKVEKEPAYTRRAATHKVPDWGSTFVEVDLSRQYLYLFVNGKVVTQGPIVTGNPHHGNATPQGAYQISYKARNAVLRGPKDKDGEYEWESPVSFWMPFNGGIGLHDASWQSAFGGSRYLTHGSHGCVNLQYSVAQTIFENVTAGTPVICHY